MNPVSIASVAASLLGLALSIWLFIANSSAQSLQDELQKRQQELQNQQQLVQGQQQKLQLQQDQIQTGNALSQQVGPQVLQSLGQAVVQNKNEKIRGLLSKYGINVQENAATPKPAAPKPAATPAPSTTPQP